MRAADIMLFDYPRFTPAETYERVAERMGRALGREESVVAVYQLGGASAPGISDLDMLVVFADGGSSRLRPRALIDDDARYLFVHGIFGVTESRFEAACRWTLFGGFRLRWGRELRSHRSTAADEAPEEVRRQVAAEYLTANYVARVVEATYRLASMRNILLWGNALRYDLALLRVNTGTLHELLEELQEWRTRWFDRGVSPTAVRRWFGRIVPALEELLEDVLAARPLATPTADPISYARHIRVRPATHLSWRHRGLVWPRGLASLHRRSFRLQHRLNRFEFRIPCEAVAPGSPLAERSAFFDSLVAERERAYPGFSPFITGWHARLRRGASWNRAA